MLLPREIPRQSREPLLLARCEPQDTKGVMPQLAIQAVIAHSGTLQSNSKRAGTFLAIHSS